MNWPEISIEDFPPRRDDEPSSLRQEIIDELSDHFACALNRELLKNPDEQVARRRVLERFGNPIKVARQLWLEAMKEKIMSQRIMTGMSIAMAVCCIAVVGIAWSMMKQSERVNLKMLDQLAVIADRPQVNSKVVEGLQRTNDAIVRELKRLSTSVPVAKNVLEGVKGLDGVASSQGTTGAGQEEDAAAQLKLNEQILQELKQLNQKQTVQSGSAANALNQISFQLVQEGAGDKPVVGFSGELVKVGDLETLFKVRAVSDENGKLDFGKLPAGRYVWKLQAPWNETCAPWNENPFTNAFVTIPERDYSQTIVCPASAPQDVPVRFHVSWPENLNSDDWILICDFRFRLRGKDLGLPPINRKELTPLAFNSGRTYQDRLWISEQDLQGPQTGVYLIRGEGRVSPCPLSAQGAFENLSAQVLTDQKEVLLRQGEYHLPVVYLLHKTDLKKLSELNQPKPVAFKSISDQVKTLQFYNRLEQKAEVSCFINPFEQLKINNEFKGRYGTARVAEVHGIELKKCMTFIADEAQPDVWEIDVPAMEFIPSALSASISNP